MSEEGFVTAKEREKNEESLIDKEGGESVSYPSVFIDKQ